MNFAFNAALTESLHKANGANGYIWRTRLDADVRPAHADLEATRQKLCSQLDDLALPHEKIMPPKSPRDRARLLFDRLGLPYECERPESLTVEQLRAYRNLHPIIYVKCWEKSIDLTLRYLCSPRKRRPTESQLWELILTRIKDEKSIQLKEV